MDEVLITSVGLVSCIGLGASASAAAARAGISRYALSHQTTVPANVEGTEEQEARVALVPFVPDDLIGGERSRSLLVEALRECAREGEVGSIAEGRLLVIVQTALAPGQPDDAGMQAACLDGLPSHAVSRFETMADPMAMENTSLFAALSDAVEELRAGRHDAVLVAAVDSPATPPKIETLQRQGRLKSAVRADGIIPGEAAGAVLVETRASASRRGQKSLARILSLGRGWEPSVDGGAPKAKGMTEAFRTALGDLPDRAAPVSHVVIDLNGERARSVEWALTEPRVFGGGRDQPVEVWHPADCAGDVGAATGAVLLAVCTHVLTHPRSGVETIATAAAGESGDRRVICLGREGT